MNVRPFDDIPEVGYSERHESWLMLMSEAHDGFAPIIARVEAFTVSRRGTDDAKRLGLSEHDVYDLLAAGIRIGIARERQRNADENEGPKP
jgi:hypothetical protein